MANVGFLQVRGIKELYIYEDQSLMDQVVDHISHLNEYLGCNISVKYNEAERRVDIVFGKSLERRS